MNKYAAPTEDLWNQMVQALGNVPMSITSHQNVQAILAQVMQQSQIRVAQDEAAKKQADKAKS